MPGDSLFLQYGAIGAIALLALIAVRIQFTRAVRAEEELAKLNELVRNQYITTLTQATTAIADMLQVLRDMRLWYGQDSGRQQGPRRKRH